MPFEFEPTEISEVVHIKPKVFGDERGWFAEIFKADDFKHAGIDDQFVQFNHSKSEQGVLRGLHYQLDPRAQGKLITVTAGTIFDVAADIRQGSPTYGKWVAQELSAEQKNMVYVPRGFAHGFAVTSEAAEVLYYCTDVYAPELERGIIWNDPTLAIDWPIDEPTLSEKDVEYPLFEAAENTFTYVL